MKRIMFFIVCLMLCLCLVACNEKSDVIDVSGEDVVPSIAEEDQLSMIYDKGVTQSYTDIRDLDENYNTDLAIADNCLVIAKMVYNDNLYDKFMEKYNQKEDAFIRVVFCTVEGDAIINDILYDKAKDRVYIVIDNTRDAFSAQSDRTIEMKEYEKIGEYDYEDYQFWVAFNGELNDETFEKGECYTIARIY